MADLVFLVTFVFLAIAGFRVSLRWGIVLLLAPFGGIFFCVSHWQEGGKLYLLKAGSYLALILILLSNPALFKQYGRYIPFSSRLADLVAKEEKAHPPEAAAAAPGGEKPPAAAPAVVADPHAAQRAALASHAAELGAFYAQLNKERATLKKGSPGVAAFNVKAAKYQEGVKAFAAEQAQLAALDHPAAASTPLAQGGPAPAPGGNPKEAEAAAALARLRATAAAGDYATFAGTLKTCLADYRQTAAFPQIASTARGTLANATPARLAAAIQGQGAAARAEEEAAMGRARGIINQTPPAVPAPSRGADVYSYSFHPGALTPDYAHADLVSTRELWKGEFVHLDNAPNVYYRSADCEFNPQTKFFFTSRNAPKKKLTDAEVAEVVRLYRVIAADERLLAGLPQRLREAQAASADLLALNKQLAAVR